MSVRKATAAESPLRVSPNSNLLPASDSAGNSIENSTWRVLVYMAGDNNLQEECIFALTEIKNSRAAKEKIPIITQLDLDEKVREFNFLTQTEIGLGNQSSPVSIESDRVILQNLNTQSTLQHFLVKYLSPNAGTHSLVVLSGHGSGSVGDFLKTDTPPSALSIPNLRSVIKSATGGGKIDILGMDSCLMSMAEVCYELRKEVRYIVGAEGFQRSTGWPYQEILDALAETPKISPAEFAKQIARACVNFYSPYQLAGVSVDHSVCDLSKMEMVAVAVKALSQSLIDALVESADRREKEKIIDAILLSHWRAQSYKFEQYVDLFDFCDLLAEKLAGFGFSDHPVGMACKQVKISLEGASEKETGAILHSFYSGAAFQHSHGLSIYFPWSKTDLDRDLPTYYNLTFADVTGWAEFLRVYGVETQRSPRNRFKNAELPPNASLFDMPQRLGSEEFVRVEPNTGKVEPNTGKGVRTRVAPVKNPPTKFFKDPRLELQSVR